VRVAPDACQTTSCKKEGAPSVGSLLSIHILAQIVRCSQGSAIIISTAEWMRPHASTLLALLATSSRLRHQLADKESKLASVFS